MNKTIIKIHIILLMVFLSFQVEASSCSEVFAGSLKNEAQVTSEKQETLIKNKQESHSKVLSQKEKKELDLIVGAALKVFLSKEGAIVTQSEIARELDKPVRYVKQIFDKTNTSKDMMSLLLWVEKHDKRGFKQVESKLKRIIALKFWKELKKDLIFPNLEKKTSTVLGISKTTIKDIFGSSHKQIIKNMSEFVASEKKKDFEQIENKILTSYTNLAKQIGRTPEKEEFMDFLDLRSENFETLIGERGIFFKNMKEVSARAYGKKPKAFEKVIDTSVFNAKRDEKMMQSIEKSKGVIVTTAVAGSKVDTAFFETLLNYAKDKSYTILVFPANFKTTGLDPVLLESQNVHIITKEISLSSKVSLKKIPITAKQINPITGLRKIADKETIVVGSPKVSLENTATIGEKSPKRIITTGAVTKPNYKGGKYIQGRTDELATSQHKMAALVLAKSKGKGSYSHHHVFFDAKEKGLNSLGVFYSSSGQKKASEMKALVLGDIHVGETDPKVLESFLNFLSNKIPKGQKDLTIVLHDTFNGKSVSHWDSKDVFQTLKKGIKKENSLVREVTEVAEFFKTLLKKDRRIKLSIVDSNHDRWLKNYINDKERNGMKNNMSESPQDVLYRKEIYLTWLKEVESTKGEKDPDVFKIAIEKTEVLSREELSRINFLNVNESVTIKGVEISQHGDKGSNGARGSLAGFKNIYGSNENQGVIIGHSHTSGRYNDIVQVGTFTKTALSYNKGISSWDQSFAIIHKDGSIQLVTFNKDTESFYEGSLTQKELEKFHNEGRYPQMKEKENNALGKSSTGQIDQFGEN